ncbi:unnamed protein product [Paramecium primaurelia]|uniref:Uncharacterized protein n=1 Tax=Paramecium primaurelia TaxID=5886 RepID=A0A8S1NHU8_PARPR|nr:unnamed protein product [Paramecium primaurelia]
MIQSLKKRPTQANLQQQKRVRPVSPQRKEPKQLPNAGSGQDGSQQAKGGSTI